MSRYAHPWGCVNLNSPSIFFFHADIGVTDYEWILL